MELTLIMSPIGLRGSVHLLLEPILLLSVGMNSHGFMQSTMDGGVSPGLETRTKVSDYQAPELMIVRPHSGGIPVTGRMSPIRFSAAGGTGGDPVVMRPVTDLLKGRPCRMLNLQAGLGLRHELLPGVILCPVVLLEVLALVPSPASVPSRGKLTPDLPVDRKTA